MNVEIGAEATQFPEKEYINGNAIAVCLPATGQSCHLLFHLGVGAAHNIWCKNNDK
jgi:hypothetical protein